MPGRKYCCILAHPRESETDEAENDNIYIRILLLVWVLKGELEQTIVTYIPSWACVCVAATLLAAGMDVCLRSILHTHT